MKHQRFHTAAVLMGVGVLILLTAVLMGLYILLKENCGIFWK